MKTKNLLKYTSIFGILIFIILLTQLDIPKLFKILDSIKIGYLIVGFAIFAFSVIIRGYKFKLLINMFYPKFTLWDGLKTYLIGIFFGSITPGKSGDLLKVSYITEKTPLSTKECISISIFDKIIDFIILFGFATISLIIVSLSFFQNSNILSYLLIISSIALILNILILTKHILAILNPLYRLFIPLKLKPKVKEIFNIFLVKINIIKKDGSFAYYISLMIISWLLIFISPFFFSRAIGIELGFGYFIILIPIVLVAELIPVSVLGVGSRDISLVLLFSLVGIPREEMIALSLLMLAATTIPAVITGFLISLSLKKP